MITTDERFVTFIGKYIMGRIADGKFYWVSFRDTKTITRLHEFEEFVKETQDLLASMKKALDSLGELS